MNAKSLAPFMLASTTVVIDINGEIRELVPGEVPGPGEVIVVVGQGATAATEPQIEAQLIGDGGDNFNLDLDNEIASIIEQIEEGVDPTQNEDFATAAGGQNGSSPTGTGDIERTGAETLAETQFDTSGLESQGLSETQSLTLLDLVAQAVFVGDDAVTVFETDVPWVITGTVVATETDVPTFVPQDGVAGDNGVFSIDADGNWTYVANSAFDELNIGDSLIDVFPIESTDGTVGSVTVTINGTNDLPQFVATDDFIPGGGGGEDEQLSTFAFEDGVYSFDIPENTAADVPIGQVAAEDPDNDVLIFSISTNIQNEGGEDLFQIDPDTGVISLTEAGAESFVNDFEILENVHNIVVTVTEGDGVGEPQSVDVDVIFTELNEDDNAPIFDDTDEGGVYNFEYDENSTDEYVIGTVSATDADGENVTYSIKTNVFNDAEEPLFEIDSVTGEISLTAAGVAAFTNDYELAENEHSIVVTATEDEGLGPVKTTDVTVNLDEVNLDDNAPVFEDTDEGGEYNFEYNENSTDEYVIGTVSATDADGENVTYSIKTNVFNDAEEPLFEIDSVTGEISLTAAGVAAFTNDYELAENEHSIVVTATEDEGFGPVKTTDVTVNLDEVNLDDNAPVFEDTDEGGEYNFEYNENSTDEYVIGTVSATDADGENVTYSIKTNVFNDAEEPLFEIDSVTGEISLTAAGVAAFTNDYELAENEHSIVVTATEDEGLGPVKTTDVTVNLDEVNLDDNAPVFDANDGDQYAFSYLENNTEDYVIGTVSATDADGEDVTYSIKTNIFNDDDEPLFEINPTNGNISLTAAGVLAFTNNFEALANEHTLVVTATEVEGFGIQKSTDIDVVLSELNVNELPVTEDFDVDAGDAIFVPIIFDSDDEGLDHISDEDDDFNGVELNVMITYLPQYGTLLYTDDFGETRVLTEADLHVMGEEIDPAKLFDPDNFTYVPGPGDPFEIGYSGDPDDIVLDDDGFYNWGEWVSDTERLITLDNGNTIGISITDNNNKPLKQYTGDQPHVGWGIGDTDGNGMNKQEALIIDFSDNPLDVVTFGLDGMGAEFNTNSSVYVEVTYTFADGTTHVEQYQKDEGDVGNEQILYEFSYSSPDNPIVEMELSSTGGNWELRYLSGTQDITEDVTFDYVAVDSDLAISNESTVTIDVSESPEYEVLSAAEGDDLDAELGNQVMLGDENDNVFTWLDSTLDNGTDVVDNFDLGNDLIDLRGILEEDDNVLVGDLIDSISTEVDGDDVVMTVTDDGREQTIILEGVTNAFEDAGLVENNSITNELEMLTQVLKTDAA
ncbi:VCBS domain-containing protein [Vibrio bivalvicida]|uniref:Cadherin domain-containing protein n=2 Tax=Vibrio TaxID=662 RepID=A0A177Y6V5_9VIBR|nr:VCBS domain-containing protein [Vibrio bivalvicida]OAJ96225.1 hypothetical protein APB76_00210 [Vibrio bivalvicida]